MGAAAQSVADAHRAALGLSPSDYVFPDREPFGPGFPRFSPPSGRARLLSLVRRRLRIPGVQVSRIAGFVAFVPKGCVLSADVEGIMSTRVPGAAVDLLYGNSIHYVGNESRDFSLQLRPGWSPERLRSHCYVGHVLLASRELVQRCGGKRVLRGLTSHGRALLLSEHAAGIERLDGLLYATVGVDAEPASDLGAVIDHCRRTGIDAECSNQRSPGVVDVIRRPAGTPRVAVIIPTRGTTTTVFGRERVMVVEAVRSLVTKSAYPNMEFIVVADTETPAGVRESLESIPHADVTVVGYDRPFNFAEKINLGAVHTDAEYLLFMNDDVEVLSGNVIEVLLAHLADESVGQVGPLLLFEDGSIQSAGHLLNPVPFDLYRGYPPGLGGGQGILLAAREVSSVIAAFSMTRAADFRAVGGLSGIFPGDYNDVDFALKLAALGKRTVITPVVRCCHFESKTRSARPDPVAVARLGSRWQHVVENDPYGNPFLQPYEFVWKADLDTRSVLDDAFGVPVAWDDEEWSRLRALPERSLHRTMYHPRWIKWVTP